MILLGLGVVLFALCHLTLAVPQAHDALRRRFGKYYGPGFGLLSLIPLVLIILGWRMSPFVPAYEPPSWGRIATFILVLLAFLCLGVFLFRGSLRQRLRFPLAWAVVFWSLGHLLANGDLASLILFGGMLIYALAHLALGTANGIRPSSVVRQGHDVISIVIGVALYGVVAQLHALFTGVPVVTLS
ncbi:NnrU family protein [Taklimakanibacter deserti]|uniref:NnrU family protein n=1 Tax=Taklimakanibacter deserti TaxID=2267839 RepID=UPI000E65D261